MRYIIFSLLIICTGCTHTQLRKNTVRQAWSLGDVYQQQVMNNLAMFVYDSGALPSFSYANQSGSSVTDQGNAGMTPGWSRITSTPAFPFFFNTLGTSFGLQRSQQESFTMTPVNDPRKLELMRCAYQKVLASAGIGGMSTTCPDCQSRLNAFYTGDIHGDISARNRGTVTSECLNGSGWFGVGCKKCQTKDCGCTIVGEYCGVYVWVLPGRRDELAKLTLVILDYALNNSPTPLTKNVVFYLDEQGLPTTQNKAVSSVSGTVNVDENIESLLHQSDEFERKLRDKLQHQLFEIDQMIAAFPASGEAPADANREDIQRRNDLLAQRDAILAQLRYLDIQASVGALKQGYTRGTVVLPGSSNAILSTQTLNTLSAPAVLPSAAP